VTKNEDANDLNLMDEFLNEYQKNLKIKISPDEFEKDNDINFHIDFV